eukprot:4078919-Amphidinium_carterae.1
MGLPHCGMHTTCTTIGYLHRSSSRYGTSRQNKGLLMPLFSASWSSSPFRKVLSDVSQRKRLTKDADTAENMQAGTVSEERQESI